MRNFSTIYLKKRLLYFLTTLFVIFLGLGSRYFTSVLPAFIVAHFGDALWAAMVYFGWRVIISKKSKRMALLLTLIFCFGIETSQLYQGVWINEIRNTLLGALILGKGFLWIDWVRYTAGAFIAFVVDKFLFPKNLKK